MEVILMEHIRRLGGIGDVVKVKDGFARNFLLPNKKAVRATKENKAMIEAQRSVLEKQNNERKVAAEAIAAKLKGAIATVVRQAADDGKLYGSVAVRDIALGLKEAGHEVESRLIDLTAPIKAIGVYTVAVALHPEVRVDIKVNVTRNAESPLPAELLDKPKAEAAAPAADEAAA